MTTMHHPEHLLDRAAMVAMRLMLRFSKGSVSGPDARKPFDEMLEKVKAASRVTYDAILYLHGGGYVVGGARAYQGLVALELTKIALAGDSAGGGLALTGESMKTRAEADPLSTPVSLAAMARLYLGDRDARDPLASPLYGDLAGLPPVRMHVGEDDVLLDDSVRYGEPAAVAA